MTKRIRPEKLNLSAEYIVTVPWEQTWVVGWVFANRDYGEQVMREVAAIIATSGKTEQ